MRKITNHKPQITKLLVRGGENKVVNELYTFDDRDLKINYLFKAVVEDRGSLDLRAKIVINKSAIGADVYLKMQVLLLDEGARAVVVPELEILANEVKAGHAASVGRVDEGQIFYLMSRGLTRVEAVELIVEAFLK